MGRAPCCDKANVKKGPWSPEEDAKLKAYIDNYGTGGNWIALPQKIGLKRCGKSCRLRWLNYLRPNIKHGGFTEEEDNIILSLYISIGSRWSIIAAQLPGRTDNDIKNYWNTRLKKKLLGRRKQPQNGLNGAKDELPSLSSSALERLQLHMQLQSQQGHQNSLSLFSNPAICPKLHPLIQEKILQNSLQSLNPQMIQYPYNSNLGFFPQSPSTFHLQTNNNDNNNGMVTSKEHVDEMENSSLNGSTSSGSSNLLNTTTSAQYGPTEVGSGGSNLLNQNNNDEDNYDTNNINDNSNGKNPGVTKSKGCSIGMQRVLSFQSELNELLAIGKVGNHDFEAINGWWSNDSNSTTYWDAASTVGFQFDNGPSMLYNQNYD